MAVIQEVLGGMLTPEQAAGVLEVSVPRYYALELKALEGMARACEPKSPGRQPSPEREAERLRRDKERLERECARHQALARSAQRALGLAVRPAPEAPRKDANGKKRRKRRPSARALQVARVREEIAVAMPHLLVRGRRSAEKHRVGRRRRDRGAGRDPGTGTTGR